MTTQRAMELVSDEKRYYLTVGDMKKILHQTFQEITRLTSAVETSDRRISELEKMAHPPAVIPFEKLEERVAALEGETGDHCADDDKDLNEEVGFEPLHEFGEGEAAAIKAEERYFKQDPIQMEDED